MHWIGSLDQRHGICVAWHTSNIKTWQDLFDKDFVVGGFRRRLADGNVSDHAQPAVRHQDEGRLRLQGRQRVYLAMERGEVDGAAAGSSPRSMRPGPDWFPQKKVSVPIQIALERDPLFPDVPARGEFAKDERTQQILQLLTAPQDMDRPILAPPGVPADRVAALRGGFQAAMNDPGFIADARKQHLEIKQLDGDKMARIVDEAYALSPEIVRAASEAVKPTNSPGPAR